MWHNIFNPYGHGNSDGVRGISGTVSQNSHNYEFGREDGSYKGLFLHEVLS